MRSTRSLAFATLILSAVSTGRASAQTLRTAAFGDRDRPTIELIADANLRALLAQNTNSNPQSAAASLGLTYRTESVLATLLVNAVGQSEALRRDFGASLLAPATGPSLSAGLIDLAFRIGSLGSLCQALAIHAYGSVGSARWRFGSNEDEEVGVVTGGAGGALRCLFFSGSVGGADNAGGDGSRVAAFIEGGPAFRTLGGEIASASNESLRLSLLGTIDRPQWGAEGTLGLEFNGVKAALTYYSFQNDIPGMSDGQVVAGFSVQTALFRGLLDRPRREPDYRPRRRR